MTAVGRGKSLGWLHGKYFVAVPAALSGGDGFTSQHGLETASLTGRHVASHWTGGKTFRKDFPEKTDRRSKVYGNPSRRGDENKISFPRDIQNIKTSRNTLRIEPYSFEKTVLCVSSSRVCPGMVLFTVDETVH